MKMREMILKFPDLIDLGWKIGGTLKEEYEFSKVLFMGMGGSAIAAEIISSLAKYFGKIQMDVVKGYEIPKWVDQETLAIGISYSGNTEETITSFEKALKKTKKVIGISSGGKLEKICEEKGIPHLKLLEGFAPRAAFPMTFFCLLRILEGQIGVEAKVRESKKAIKHVEEEFAKRVASEVVGSVPVIYAAAPLVPVAKRWANQFNENAKMLAFFSEFPEMNHNEIVGWGEDENAKNFSTFILESGLENERIKLRYKLTRELALKNAKNFYQILAIGEGIVPKICYLVHLSDWISYHSALIRGADPLEIRTISELKKLMAKSSTE